MRRAVASLSRHYRDTRLHSETTGCTYTARERRTCAGSTHHRQLEATESTHTQKMAEENDVTMLSRSLGDPSTTTSASEDFCGDSVGKTAAAGAAPAAAGAGGSAGTEEKRPSTSDAAAADSAEPTAARGRGDADDETGGGDGPAEAEEDRMSAHTADSHFLSEDDVAMEEGKADEQEEEFPDKSPEELMTLALSCKDRGNELFRSGSVPDAKEAYTSGLKYVKELQFPDAKTLRVALNSNVAMCCLKLEEWQQAIAAADAVLKEEPLNVKALYRRGMGRASFGLYSDAKADLLQVLRLDARNVDARKELEKLKEKIAKDNTEKKKAYSGLFDRAAGMYADREEQMQRRRQEAAETEAKLRKEWEAEMQTRKEDEQEEIPFEDWREQKEKAREKEKKRESLAAQHTDSPVASLGRSKKNEETARVGDTLELDEEDKKIIDETKKMGYCYFRRDLTEEERKLNAQHLPTKIDTSAALADASGSPSGTEANGSCDGGRGGSELSSSTKTKQQSGVSSWNAKGTTYEEKDMSQWGRRRFEERLLETRVTNGGNLDALRDPKSLLSVLQRLSPEKGGWEETRDSLQEVMNQLMTVTVKCTEVKELTGDAQVVVMRGSKRYLFEFSCTTLFEIEGRYAQDPSLLNPHTMPSLPDTSFSYKGEMTLPEVSSAEGKGEAWLSGSRVRMKKKVSPEHKDSVDRGIEAYKKQLVEQIHLFLADFSKAA